jgi:hypothetical protein
MNINFLWIGDSLTKNGQLTLKSFIDHGHTPVLWAYNKQCENIPEGVVIEDAGQILPPSKIFSYKNNGDCRQGSYGGFSDIFRYYLLYEVGGWYCDMDVVCLKNFEEISSAPYVLRPHKTTPIVANIIKTPKACEFIKKCIDNTESQVDENNCRWIRPLEILSDTFKMFDLEQYVVPKEYFGDDDIRDIKQFIDIGYHVNKFKLPTYALHWCNEAITTGQWDRSIKRDWESPMRTTLYRKLLKQHNLL